MDQQARVQLGAQVVNAKYDGRELTTPARLAFSKKFAAEDDFRNYMRDLAPRSNDQRRGGLVLSADEVAALAAAFELLEGVAERVKRKATSGGPGDALGGAGR
jgi:hypothetical protein